MVPHRGSVVTSEGGRPVSSPPRTATVALTEPSRVLVLAAAAARCRLADGKGLAAHLAQVPAFEDCRDIVGDVVNREWTAVVS